MFRLRRGADRGHLDHGWLDTYHTFSFGDYHDPAHVHFHALRVMNEDRIAGGMGFGMHPHCDMEIVTYVLSGELAHRDSLGNGEVLHAGELQRMTAGTGIRHSEFNPSPDVPVHLYQIWLLPEERGLEPSYEQKRFSADERQDAWQLVASPDAADGSLRIRQDARLYLARASAGSTLARDLAPGRSAWLQVLTGSVESNGEVLQAGDGAALSDEAQLSLTAREASEVLVFDLA